MGDSIEDGHIAQKHVREMELMGVWAGIKAH